MFQFKQSFLLGRIIVGVSFFGHGLVRMPILKGFSAWMVGEFEKSILPSPVVELYSYSLPFLELIIGVFLLIGLFTRHTLISAALVMISLVFGSTTIQQWEAIPSQLIHFIIIAVLLALVDRENSLSIDSLSKKSRT